MKTFTITQVARICKVSPRIASKWFDAGQLKGYRIPGTKDRCVPHEYLIQFLKEHGMPWANLENAAKILIVAQDQVMIENLKRELPESFKTTSVRSGFDAGVQVESFLPDCIIVDFSIGHVEALEICQSLRRRSELSEIILIALLDHTTPTSFDRSSINETFKKPFDAALLAERLQTLVG